MLSALSDRRPADARSIGWQSRPVRTQSANYHERRRRLMDDWAAYLGGARGHVVA